MNDTLSSECHKLKRKHVSWPVTRANGTHLVLNILLTVASEKFRKFKLILRLLNKTLKVVLL